MTRIIGWTCLLVIATHSAAQAIRSPRRDKVQTRKVRLVFSANTQGVLEPCGCQAQQGGGLARRAAALEALTRALGPQVLLDGGNLIASLSPNPKVFDEARDLLKGMGYSAGVIGPAELNLGPKTLREHLPNSSLPCVNTNVVLKEAGAQLRLSLPFTAGKVRFELFAALDPASVSKDYICRSPADALSLPARRASAHHRMPVLISYQSLSNLEATLKAIPSIALALAHTAELDPETPRRFGRTWIVPVPLSGKQIYVIDIDVVQDEMAVVALKRVDLPPSLTPDPQVSSRIRAFYDRNRLGRPSMGPTSLPARTREAAEELVKAAARECGSCHAEQEQEWSASRHAHAWITLKSRQAEQRPECVSCHTTPLQFVQLGSGISGVGCGTCHGEGSQHAADPHTKGLISRTPEADVCAACHTSEASPRFEYEQYLKLVKH
jgi:hypothetical protein